jgi:hypothetical protein
MHYQLPHRDRSDMHLVTQPWHAQLFPLVISDDPIAIAISGAGPQQAAGGGPFRSGDELGEAFRQRSLSIAVRARLGAEPPHAKRHDIGPCSIGLAACGTQAPDARDLTLPYSAHSRAWSRTVHGPAHHRLHMSQSSVLARFYCSKWVVRNGW